MPDQNVLEITNTELIDAIHTHFVTLIGKWTIVGGWVKHLADKRDKVAETRLPKILGEND